MKLFSIEELATLTAQENTDCVSIYMPTFKMSTETLQNPIRFKNLMREAEEKLIANGMRPQDARDLLLPVQELDEYDSVVLISPEKALTQQIPITPTTPQPEETETATDGLFFADIIVRGQPVFQVGSVGSVNASQRAQIVNRRIAGILAQPQANRNVTTVPDQSRGIATLQVGNRVLLTVTQQDAQDFNEPVETLAQQWAQQVNQAFEQPALAIDVGQRLYTTVRQFQRDTIDNLPSFLGATLALGATWIIAASVRRLTLFGSRQWEVDRNSKILVSWLMYGGVWVIGSVVALGVLGLDFATLVGTLGLTSVAIGFSLRDVLSNYFSGIILLTSRPFRLGDQIIIKEFEVQ